VSSRIVGGARTAKETEISERGKEATTWGDGLQTGRNGGGRLYKASRAESGEGTRRRNQLQGDQSEGKVIL